MALGHPCGHSARFPQGKGWFRAAMWPKWAFSEGKNMVLGQPCGHSVRFPKEKGWFGHPEGGGRVDHTSCMFRKMQRFVLF